MYCARRFKKQKQQDELKRITINLTPNPMKLKVYFEFESFKKVEY